jgi:hypothetical protein
MSYKKLKHFAFLIAFLALEVIYWIFMKIKRLKIELGVAFFKNNVNK